MEAVAFVGRHARILLLPGLFRLDVSSMSRGLDDGTECSLNVEFIAKYHARIGPRFTGFTQALHATGECSHFSTSLSFWNREYRFGTP